MSSAISRTERATRTDTAPGVVDVSAMTATELERFVDAGGAFDGDVRIQRRGSSAYLLTE